MELSEDQWSHIDTHEEALALANYALSDLKEPKATMEVDLPYFWPLELNDLVRFEANSVHHDQPIDLAVTGFTHTLFEDGGREHGDSDSRETSGRQSGMAL